MRILARPVLNLSIVVLPKCGDYNKHMNRYKKPLIRLSEGRLDSMAVKGTYVGLNARHYAAVDM